MAASLLSNKQNNLFVSSNPGAESSAHPAINSRICICLVCGLPGSGKSTLLRSLSGPIENSSEMKRLLKLLSMEKCDIVGIEYDSFIPVQLSTLDRFSQWHEQELSGTWKFDRTQMVSATEALIQHICSNSKADLSPEMKPQEVGMDVWQHFLQIFNLLTTERQNGKTDVVLVVDDNMYFRSMRYQYYKLARRYQTGYCQIYVKCSIDKAIERNKSRNDIQRVPEEIILKMCGKFEEPDQEKYHWETNSITVSSEGDIDIHPVLTMIQQAIINPVQSLEEPDEEERFKSRIECSASMLHQADLILRKCMTAKMTDCKAHVKPEKLKDISKHVFQVKEKIMRDLKSGHIPLIFSKDLNVMNSAQDPDSEMYRFFQNIFLMEISRS